MWSLLFLLTPCDLSPGEVRWVQKALDGWERVAIEVLELDRAPLPRIVLFDESCVWHLAAEESELPDARLVRPGLTFAGEPVPAVAQPYEGGVALPGGATIPPRAAAFASLYPRSGILTPFFVLALPGLWRSASDASGDSRLEAEMLGVFSHEIVHTLQLAHAAARVEALKERYTLPGSIGDDVVEDRFGGVPAFRAAYEAETDLLYRAVSESDPERKGALVADALERVRARKAKYFVGPDAVYGELEDLFLNMEGAAVWAAYTLSRLDPAFDMGIEDPAADRKRNTWSQDRGLALFLLVDDLVAGWKGRVLGPEVESPYALLGEVVGRRQDGLGSSASGRSCEEARRNAAINVEP